MFIASTIQYKAVYGQPEKNREKLLELCYNAVKTDADIIILPEMCLTGYIWPHRDRLYKIAERADGETFAIFAEFCFKKDCYLAYGFAEYEDDKLYNSQNFIGPDGRLLLTYRKMHLFFADLLWAHPGNRGFQFVDTPIGRVGLGICMDLNFDDFVDFHIANKTEWLLFAANWLKEDIDVHAYWKKRFRNYRGTAFIANTFGHEYIIEFCGKTSVYESGEFTSIAPEEGNYILLSRHRRNSLI